MVPGRLRVGAAQNGSMNAVSGSGMASMSLASMPFQPRMDEPSNPNPSLKTSSVNSAIGQLKCCQVPKVSTNFTSTILAPSFFAISNTLFAVLICWLGIEATDSIPRPETRTGLLSPPTVEGFDDGLDLFHGALARR